jgi:hypothetical protein
MLACGYYLARAEGRWASADCFSAGVNASTAGDSVMWRALTTACMRLGPRASGWEMDARGLLCCGRKRKNAKEQKKKKKIRTRKKKKRKKKKKKHKYHG